MYLLAFYVPIDVAEDVKNALFEKGAGKIGDYSSCAWQVLGEGQYKPLPGSNPAIGQTNQIEKVKEFKVEMVCSDEHIKAVIDALKANHPYEEPAYQVLKINDL